MLKYIFCCLLVFLLCSCGQNEEERQNKSKASFIVVSDELGRSIKLDTIPQRILPLCASSMEYVVILCDSARIIGRTPDVEWPTWLIQKPVVVNYPLDIEQVLSLKPDLVVSKEGMLSLELVNKLESLGIKVYMQKANSLQNIFDGLAQLGLVLGRETKGIEQAKKLQLQFDSLNASAAKIPKSSLIFISTDPLYVFGAHSYMSDVLSNVGMYNAVDSTIEQLYPMVDQEFVLKVNPDYFILPLSLKASNGIFSKYPLLKKTKAFQSQQCIYVNDDWLSRPSPNVLKAALYIANEMKAHEKK
jgi:iron complex transport system substrate-binding protein